MTQMTPILVRLPPELLAQIDAARGDVPRAVWIRRCCEKAVSPPRDQLQDYLGSDPTAPMPPMMTIAEYEERVIKPYLARMREESGTQGLNIQLGPAAVKPGSRLKKDKR